MNAFRARSFTLLTLSLALLGACDDGNERTPGTGDAGVDANVPDGDVPDASLTDFDALAVGEWHEVNLPGNLRCADGSPYKFFLYKGSSPNLAINFFGGGGCWNAFTCKEGSGLYTRDISEAQEIYERGRDGEDLSGIFDMEDERNPILDYTHVLVPYCTGDVHWGNTKRVYGEGENAFDIYHQGGTNARAVLDWVFGSVDEPETVLTTGCSAGAYGAALWGAHVAHHYDGARNVLLADSGAGVITPTFFGSWLPNWDVEPSFPDWIADFDLENIDSITDLYTKIGMDNGDLRQAQFNTDEDSTQKLFFAAMGGDANAWSSTMQSQVTTIAGEIDNFRYYQSTGEQHCIIVYDDFYTRTTDGTLFVDWVDDLLTEDELPTNVTCTLCSE